jgi:hypothetical protein
MTNDVEKRGSGLGQANKCGVFIKKNMVAMGNSYI